MSRRESYIRLFIAVTVMVAAYVLLKELYDAPRWGAIVGSWVCWSLIRPKEWS